jgi:hypothetical protein
MTDTTTDSNIIPYETKSWSPLRILTMWLPCYSCFMSLSSW